MKKVCLIIGARPNFMKAFPVYEALKDDFDITLIHTGQHFDAKMSDVFFNQLKFPKPDIHLSLEKKTKSGDFDDKLYVNNDTYLKNKDNVIKELVGYNGDLGQLGEIRDKLKIEFEKIEPELVIVFGDVTSTLSAGLAAKMLNIDLVHIESGLRSGDIKMPEEVNRILTDHITKYYFVTEQSGIDNFNKEGITENVYLVGNTMIDTQKKYLQQALDTKYHETLKVKSKEYVLITLHRPSNVDDTNKLKEIFDDLEKLSQTEKLVYPIHPRTKNNLEKMGYLEKVMSNPNIILDEPLGYLEFTCLMANCKYLVTDSGGLQEESTALDIPCFTLRENTERPSTLIENNGTNQMIHKISEIELKECKGSMDLWDGKSSIEIGHRIYAIVKTYGYKQCIITNLNSIDNNTNNFYNYKGLSFLSKLNSKNENIVVNFHGSIPSTLVGKYDVMFRGYNYNINNTDIVCVSDFLLNKYKLKYSVNWTLSTNKHSNTDIIYNEVFNHIINNSKKYKNVVFTGSSAGGFPSIKFASFFNATAIIANSQLYLENYINNKGLLAINKYIDYNDEVTYTDKMIEEIILQSPPKKIIYYQNINDIGPNPHNSYNDFLQFKMFVENNNLNEMCDFNSFEPELYDKRNQHGIQYPNNKYHINILQEFFCK
jgi:UDP-N-acetylglucosamine 2-epimerase (non-hydrolysing)